jgi:hypothetical protein
VVDYDHRILRILRILRLFETEMMDLQVGKARGKWDVNGF